MEGRANAKAQPPLPDALTGCPAQLLCVEKWTEWECDGVTLCQKDSGMTHLCSDSKWDLHNIRQTSISLYEDM